MSTLTTINSGDLITNSRADINNNFSALNNEKIETSYLSTDTTLSDNSDSKIPTQKAVKAYVDAGGNVNASTTTKGIVEEATNAEILAGTATGATGARLFINPSTAYLLAPIVRTYNTADSPATWTKPTGLKYIDVQVWGGGGGGGQNDGAGGGGGAYNTRRIQASDLGTTETVTIGAGGAGRATAGIGNPGGNSSFGSLCLAYGGGGGGYTAGGGGGGGGGISSIGSNGSDSVGGAGGNTGGGTAGSGGNGGDARTSFGGGGGGDAGFAGGFSTYGGAGGGGGSNNAANIGGNSVYGGGGGSGRGGSAGTSVYGGNGGTGNGAVPAGGGGGVDLTTSGSGGNGRVILTEYYV